ncbi:tetratricopeptide repeat protein [Pseudoalteromonas obscura]|uniref:Tetratricopeptide repeat protein n=1 Tax=Pseudoalteromonas obscura TaxID=3048491 RepID=A0ABT7ELS9_9GAMM|nr:tetratricopeptide repeat protein [Pseudoalteromonas sp. P94(2023)]MDK2596020.1 tetratricopeptide repeat protein [Pseudoalteromonas sp. P94(2023)]
MINKVLFIVAWLLFSAFLEAKPSVEKQMEVLQEAEDYLTVKPSNSLRLLNAMSHRDVLPVALKIRWHIIRVRASVPTNQLTTLEQSLKALFEFETHPYFMNKLPTVLSALGIWLRRKGYLAEADMSLQCALKHAQGDAQRLTLINSRALVARHMENHQKAVKLYQRAAKLAKKLQHRSMSATINNNMGAIALDRADYVRSDRYFRAALEGYQSVDKRSGYITAGVNLLFLFVLKGEALNYQRLYSPIKAMTDAFPNQSKKAFLHWINTAHAVQQGAKLSTEEHQALLNYFSQLESNKVKALVAQHLAPIVQIEVPKVSVEKVPSFQAKWFDKVRLCEWL